MKTFVSSLPPNQAQAVDAEIARWDREDLMARVWKRDASLWSNGDEAAWLGWLEIASEQYKDTGRFRDISTQTKNAGFKHVVLLGMGGSSLCPEVLRLSFGRMDGFPDLHVLDSTDPAQVLAVEGKIDLKNTLFIVASKSGSTLEPNVFKDYFFERAGRDGERFIAITDPGSQMEAVAKQDGFRAVYYGLASIGGRFSALSAFGLVPAAVMGIDVEYFLQHAVEMQESCRLRGPGNPGLELGACLGVLAREGQNKLTLISSPGIHDLGAWLEQLIAESTGKDGYGIIPVDREPMPADFTGSYSADRVFVYSRLAEDPDAAQDRAVAALAGAGRPVITIEVPTVYDLGQEFFRWEFATAVAGSILGINPFNQPDVEASKIETRKLTNEFEAKGSLPEELESSFDGSIHLFGGASGATLEEAVRALLASMKEGDYFALLAYIEMNAAHESALTAMREKVLRAKGAATCLGFGPRFLHSTGQAYKGGPNTGVFMQITADDARDVPIPGRKYSFGVVKAAQARGDLEVLRSRGRRFLRPSRMAQREHRSHSQHGKARSALQ